mmetsp:Transcript_48690/g.110987  ORF Transcript_48690/g.110987 Transcript_48690/m.110987 type:complete len:301 (-) Transcript_48690:1-903(-)
MVVVKPLLSGSHSLAPPQSTLAYWSLVHAKFARGRSSASSRSLIMAAGVGATTTRIPSAAANAPALVEMSTYSTSSGDNPIRVHAAACAPGPSDGCANPSARVSTMTLKCREISDLSLPARTDPTSRSFQVGVTSAVWNPSNRRHWSASRTSPTIRTLDQSSVSARDNAHSPSPFSTTPFPRSSAPRAAMCFHPSAPPTVSPARARRTALLGLVCRSRMMPSGRPCFASTAVKTLQSGRRSAPRPNTTPRGCRTSFVMAACVPAERTPATEDACTNARRIIAALVISLEGCDGRMSELAC